MWSLFSVPSALCDTPWRRDHVGLAVNPEGCQPGLRTNARSGDLNRNFPVANWQSGDTVYRWNNHAPERDVILLTGERPGSEPETQTLCPLIQQLKTEWRVSVHKPLACIDDLHSSRLGRRLAEKSIAYTNRQI
ncbi:protein MpaA [Izhakiella capsodis]|uniref:Protein MpaA n=1 Tax=Izhakiella capsodis TaxID=1367852 RepID=A0A1I4V4Y8_9GAMM|nr:protein MpaA [Izhakiella capsodis]